MYSEPSNPSPMAEIRMENNSSLHKIWALDREFDGPQGSGHFNGSVDPIDRHRGLGPLAHEPIPQHFL
jgi:hypothetical protein